MRSSSLATLAVTVAVAGWLGAAEARAAAGYVPLGDSYTAGPLVPYPVGPLGCFRSSHNYPHLAASRIGLPLRDASCSGAKTSQMFTPQPLGAGSPNPPQLNSLNAATRVVSLTIGGNDIGFSGIVQSCIAANPFGSPCRRRYVAGGVDAIGARIKAVAPLVAGVLRAIRARAPRARVYVVNYPAILPEDGHGCWPQMPISFIDAPYLRAKVRQLDRMLAKQAAGTGARFVDWYAASIGHDACRPASTRWVEPLIPGNWAASIHPNRRGMQGAAEALAAAASR